MPNPDKIPGAFESEDPYAVGSPGYFTVLAHTRMAAHLVEEYVEGHLTVQGNPYWTKLAGEALDALEALCVSLAKAHL